MRSKIFKSARITSGLTALALLMAGEAALAQQQVNLTAASATATLPDGSAVPMWGYSCGAAATGSTATCASLNPAAAALVGAWSPVIITVPAGQDLQINLTNSLPIVPTSIVIVGQLGGGLGNAPTTTTSPDHSTAQSNVTWPIANNGGGSGTPPVQGPRVQSFSASSEVLTGATGSVCWGLTCATPTPALKPGTYLIESGTHPSIQGPMGLYGMLVVTTAPAGTTAGTAYPATAYTGVAATAAVTYNAEVPLLLSEIDPVQNAAVATAVTLPGFSETTVWSGLPGGCGNPATANAGNCYPPAVNYTPMYYLFNGVAFDKANAPASLFPVTAGTSTAASTTGNVLVRFVNAGLHMHIPSIVGALTTPAVVAGGVAGVQTAGFSLVAEDGNPLPGVTRVQNEVFMAAGKTYDVMVDAPAAVGTALPVYDRQLSLSSNSTTRDAGMLAYIGINGAPVPGAPALIAAAANPDTYNSVISGQTLVVSDPSKGVIANDVNISGVQLVAGSVVGGTLTLNTNGTFSFAATAASGSFGYCGNGAISGPACTTVTLGAAPIEAGSGITVPNSAYASTVSSTLSIKSPGILSGAKDAAGYPLTVDTTTVAYSGAGTLSVDPSGAFNITGAAAGTYTFTFNAKNSQGTVSAAAATVTVTFPAASGLSVTVVDGKDKTTVVPDYRWIIEEDRTFYVDPTKTTNTGAAGSTTEPTFGTNFHTSYMPVVAAGCVGPISCESGQTLLGVAAVCDGANGVCRTTASQQTEVNPSAVALDPNKRYYISILPGDGATPFETGNASGGHGMGGAPIPFATCTGAGCVPTRAPITILVQPTPFPTADLSVFVFEDDRPLNGENDAGGGALGGAVDGLAANEPGLGHFNIILFDDAGGTGDATGQMTYDMFNQPLSNSLDGTIDPATGLNACPITEQGSTNPTGITGMIVTCPRYESDGLTFSPMAGQARVANLMPGRYGVVATPGADLIAAGEEWLQTNTLDGQKAHDSFLRIGEPSYFQEFGPAGYHVSIGFANPKIINDRLPLICGGNQTFGINAVNCTNTVTGLVSTERMSRTPDERLYGSGDNSSFAFTQCYVSVGDPDGADFAFTKCNADGTFSLSGLPDGTWRVTVFDQWNDMLVDGLSTPVALAGGSTTNLGEVATNQWQANIYTQSFIDTNKNGVRDAGEPGLTLVPTNIRFRDGSYSNFNNTDLAGNAGFNEIFPLFSWYVIESDSTRFKNTGTHVVYDSGGPADGTAACGAAGYPPCGTATGFVNMANTAEQVPVPSALRVPGAYYCATADCASAPSPVSAGGPGGSSGRVDPPWVLSEGWQGFSGQNSFLEFGKTPYIPGENGGIRGEVIYASTRPFDDPQLLIHTSWTPDVPNVTINLYQEGTAPDGSQSLTLVDSTKTSSWDDWAQGFRTDGNPNMNCPGQSTADLFYFTLYNQPMYLDAYNNGGTPLHTIPNNSEFKCYDGMHNWNQLQPAPYDGMYNFPSVTARNPVTGLPTATNCTVCVANPSGDGTQMLPSGKYVVEMVTPPGYELVKEEDKNILIGDNYIAPVTVQFPNLATAVYILPDQAEVSAAYNANNAQNSTNGFGRALNLSSHEGDTGSVETFWPCVGEERVVPDYISLYPQSLEVAPFAGATRRLCDRKEVILDDQTSALAKFWIFTSAHVAAHFTGVITDDFTSEFDPFSPQFGEKFSPPNMPIAIKDWSGTEISRVYSDQWGTYNGLTYSTWEVNPPNPTGYAPTMMVTCMNDPGTGPTPDPLYNPQYSDFCYEIPFMPGQTQYMDTPVVPTSAFAGAGYNNPDCAYPTATPAISEVDGNGAGPWVSAAGQSLTISALGDQMVPNNAYSGPQATTAPYNAKTVARHYGFGSAGSVTIGGVNAPVSGWTDTQIVVTVPAGVPECAVQQQAQYGGSDTQCGELVVTTSTGQQSIDAVTVTIGGKAPIHVAATASVQAAIDAAQPGDLLMLDPTTQATATAPAVASIHQEILLMWKPIRLQGVGATASIINANTHPAGKLDPWRRQVNCLFGLSIDGTPIARHTGANPYDPNNVYTCPAAMSFAVDRIPLEAVVGWDATLNGNLAEQLQEPSLMGAYEGAGITVLGKGVQFPAATDPYGADTFPVGTLLLTGDSGSAGGRGCNNSGTNPFPSNFQCNPSRIDGLTITNSSQGGGGIFVHGWAHNLEISNNRITNNSGTLSGGISVGQGEFPGQYLRNPTTPNADPGSCLDSGAVGPTNTQEPYCFDLRVNVHHNAVTLNSSLGDELFSSTPSGAGGVAFCTGADYYKFNYNWVCGNLSTGDGGGVAHMGFSYNGDIEHNNILFNQSTNPTVPTNGGGLAVLGAPDTDPVCGNEPDADCAPGTSDGTGPNLVINANLFLGNSAESGSGGAIRLHGVNGTELTFFPTNMNRWYAVNLTNNIIANNVAGWDGAGVSLQDAVLVNLINNTIISNDTTASAGVLFNTLGAPLSSSPPPPSTTSTSTTSAPQPSGLVAIRHSPTLLTTLSGLNPALSCPARHPNCGVMSYPRLENNVFWENRTYYIGVGALSAAYQQNIVTLYNSFGTTPAPNQPSADATAPNTNGGVHITGGTGACTAASYWDIGIRGDTGPTNHSGVPGVSLSPSYSLLTSTAGYTTGSGGQNLHNLAADPSVISQYCNGSRTPPELLSAGWQVPPGIADATVPNPPFTLQATATVDEGNNWVNMSWGPLALTHPLTGAVLGNYGPAAAASPVVNYIPSTAAVNYADAPPLDFYGNARKTNNAVDAGAVEFGGAVVAPTLTSIVPNTARRGTSVAVVLTGTNLSGGTIVVSGGGFTISGVTYSPDGTTINATFTISPAATRSARNVHVTTTGGSTNNVTFTVAFPTLTSITPNNALRGTAVPVTLTGTFLTGGTVNVGGGGGVTADPATVSPDGTTLTTTLHITAGAGAGPRNVTVTTPNGGGTTNAVVFTVRRPTLTTVSPNSGARGTSVAVTLTGTDLAGASGVTVSGGGGVTVSNFVAVNDTTVTATFTVTPGTALGPRNVTVTTTANGPSTTQTFTVVNPAAPTLTSVSPNSGARGSAVGVTLTGTNFTAAGTTVTLTPAGPNVALSSVTVVNSTTITATITIGSTAMTGARQVAVHTPGAQVSNNVPFTVN